MTCLLALNGLRVSEACNANVTDLGGSRYQPTLRILGKGDKPAEIVLNPPNLAGHRSGGRWPQPGAASAQPLGQPHAPPHSPRPSSGLARPPGSEHT